MLQASDRGATGGSGTPSSFARALSGVAAALGLATVTTGVYYARASWRRRSEPPDLFFVGSAELLPERMSLSLERDAIGVVRASGELERCGGVPKDWSPWQVDPNTLQPCLAADGKPVVLGKGACGEVYLAMSNGVHPVAVKRMEVDLQGAVREVALLKALANTNVVQFQGACIQGNSLLLVTEFMEGGDLFKAIAKGAVCWRRRGGPIAMDVARGLHFLHSNRVLHLDLKSPNILLTRHSVAKIGDVGLARIRSANTTRLHTADFNNTNQGMIGTFAWAAPELLAGEPRGCNDKADMFSFGIVLWEIVTGEKPVRGRMRDVRVPEDCPQEVAQLIDQCMSYEPMLRPSAMVAYNILRTSWKASCQAAAALKSPSAAAGRPSIDVTQRLNKSFDSATDPQSQRDRATLSAPNSGVPEGDPLDKRSIMQVFENAPARLAPTDGAAGSIKLLSKLSSGGLRQSCSDPQLLRRAGLDNAIAC